MRKDTPPTPTELRLHTQRRVLEVAFDDGAHFELPCAYLRAFVPSADVKAARERGEAVRVDPEVNIRALHPVGSYAVRIEFDDGHHQGIFSWQTLYELGRDFDRNRPLYEAAVGAGGKCRSGAAGALRILYFATLAERLGREVETLEGGPPPRTVAELLARLRARGGAWREALAEEAVRVTVNKTFATPHTPLAPGDEIALVPARVD